VLIGAIEEAYGCDDAQQMFVNGFVAAWDKVMTLDRFDLRPFHKLKYSVWPQATPSFMKLDPFFIILMSCTL